MRIEYDDQPDDVIGKVNAALTSRGLRFEFDAGGDGYVDYRLDAIEDKRERPCKPLS